MSDTKPPERWTNFMRVESHLKRVLIIAALVGLFMVLAWWDPDNFFSRGLRTGIVAWILGFAIVWISDDKIAKRGLRQREREAEQEQP